MFSSMIGKWVGDRVAKTFSFAIGKSNKQEITQPEATNTNVAQQKVTKLKQLEQRLGHVLCEGVDYVDGFANGINPITPLQDWVAKELKLPKVNCSDGQSFHIGKHAGAQAGLAFDAAIALNGIKLNGSAALCTLGSAGTCSPLAIPVATIGTTEMGLGLVMGSAHGLNLMAANEGKLYRLGDSKESVSRLNRKSLEAENDPSTKIHGVSVSENKPINKDVFSSASKNEVEKKFKVHDTPRNWDLGHKTVELPKPITQEIADIFNKLFGRIK